LFIFSRCTFFFVYIILWVPIVFVIVLFFIVNVFLFVMWFLLRDVLLFFLLLFFCCFWVLLNWYVVFHEESWFIMDCLKTADKILPEWFFLLFFGFLKSIPDKFLGLVFLCLLFFCWLLFVLNCLLWFLYCRLLLVWSSFTVLCIYGLYLCGFLSLYVVLCFPLWVELNCVCCLLFCLLVCRVD